ncbi:protein kinase domain protein [Metarhizium rileyi]|uniref:Protein kinase domain protein n=1 Tax=Metarhizium rileyi (strain RCEF 4871) TaxID=1649241 RepID=A0A167EBQ8_METRR|nr:protein kinase domain protein [Metarhizium rileyi RCEF 4871]
MSAPPVEYGYIHGVEDIDDYRPGGYHPIHIDDRLNKRYRIVHKLGHGTFSTVWLALDEKTTGYVAIKLGISVADRTEIDILSQLTHHPVNCDIRENRTPPLPLVLDRFEVSGPNGNHPCLVTLPARCSLRDAGEASDSALFPLDVARSLAAQLAMALSLVHDAGYAHGDLHLGNLLLQLPSSLGNLSIEQLYARYGQPKQEPVVRVDSKAAATDPAVPSYAVHSVWLGIPSDEIALGEAKLILSDFGTAFRPEDKSRFESYTPLVLRPPEAFFEPTTPLTFASDIWSLGCVIFELLAHRSLIDGIIAPQDDILAQQVHLQGPMPPAWWAKWEERPKWFDDEGRPLSDESDIWSWERRFEQWVQSPRQRRKIDMIGEDERNALLELLGCMLAWKPSERPDTSEVLKSDWMTRWAIPAYQKGLGRHSPGPS